MTSSWQSFSSYPRHSSLKHLNILSQLCAHQMSTNTLLKIFGYQHSYPRCSHQVIFIVFNIKSSVIESHVALIILRLWLQLADKITHYRYSSYTDLSCSQQLSAEYPSFCDSVQGYAIRLQKIKCHFCIIHAAVFVNTYYSQPSCKSI